MHIGWPQGIMVVLLLLGTGSSIAKHGQPHDPYNGGMSFVSLLITLALLYWGGFFNG